MTKRSAARLVALAIGLTALEQSAIGLRLQISNAAISQPLFGPKQYVRTTGAPNQFVDVFTPPPSSRGPFVLHIINGDEKGGHRVSSGTIALNGVSVATPSDFSQSVGVIDRTVTLAASN